MGATAFRCGRSADRDALRGGRCRAQHRAREEGSRGQRRLSRRALVRAAVLPQRRAARPQGHPGTRADGPGGAAVVGRRGVGTVLVGLRDSALEGVRRHQGGCSGLCAHSGWGPADRDLLAERALVGPLRLLGARPAGHPHLDSPRLLLRRARRGQPREGRADGAAAAEGSSSGSILGVIGSASEDWSPGQGYAAPHRVRFLGGTKE
mmetsp:Transcript_118792/g.322330  ORF Transcript_118792/g.322330 Transcript_118792/m.322330 type:complete len:207 (+) Transcript_118792:138-758(+)